MKVDHGFSQILDLMLGNITVYPLVPVMINCAAPPRPTFRRVRLLGEAVGRFARQRGLRVLFVGSGGLSHDPPIPQIEGADTRLREAMINGRNPSASDRETRESRVVSVALEFIAGRSRETQSPDPVWDRQFIDLLANQNIQEVDQWSEDGVSAVAGCGGHEVRTWIAAFSALTAATGAGYRTEVDYYDVVPEWMTGMGIIHAR
jgi:2,3-dihydroxyphenylpropionate 1,2-dioxygenase